MTPAQLTPNPLPDEDDAETPQDEAPTPKKDDEAPAKRCSELSAEGKRSIRDHKVEIRLLAQASQEGIAHGSPHQRGAFGQVLDTNGPSLRCQCGQESVNAALRLQNDGRCGVWGHVYLCELPLGRPLSGLSRSRTATWCPSPHRQP